MAKSEAMVRIMDVRMRIACSPSEARQLLGLPELLPLHELVADLFERSLAARIARHEPERVRGSRRRKAETRRDRPWS